jgi:hypothetical protein
VIYVKSALVGLLALVIALALLPIVAMLVLMAYGWIHPQPEGYSVGWDPISLIRQSPSLPVAFILIVFASGFVWEFRRLMQR